MALKDEVLLLLKQANGEYISGQALARQLCVSRNAIWKAVSALKADGCAVDAATNRGYALLSAPDALDEGQMAVLLRGSGIDVQCFNVIDSTNAEGRRRAADLKHPLLLVADAQTAGRGRRGRSFYSPQKTGLYMTLTVPIALPLPDAALATQALAVAAVRAVCQCGGPELSIKWVNDLFYENRKVAGILTEAVANMETGETAALVCGIGMNLTTEDFPDDVRDVAGTLGRLERSRLAAQIALNLLPMLRALPERPWMDEYRRRSFLLGQDVSFSQNGVSYIARADAIDDIGRLLVTLPNGTQMALSSGEVSVRLK